LQELGLNQTVNEIATAIQTTKSNSNVKRRKHIGQTSKTLPSRRSGRIQGQPPESLAEDELWRRIGMSDHLDLILPTRRRRTTLDPKRLHDLQARRRSTGTGGVDSGLGVRVQGGRVYDSRYGVTCHWCRQKTLEAHIECTSQTCGGGSRLRVAFCRMCLRNRHGEDVEQAIASGKWICPVCRGSCGPGCVSCCNCGPCRKRAGLGPTHQIIKQARLAGFTNVHDYLVARETKESPDEISARKVAHAWGNWLSVPYSPVDDGDGNESTEDEIFQDALDIELDNQQARGVPGTPPPAAETTVVSPVRGTSSEDAQEGSGAGNILTKTRAVKASRGTEGKSTNAKSRREGVLWGLGLGRLF
jgi:hypothetical protein